MYRTAAAFVLLSSASFAQQPAPPVEPPAFLPAAEREEGFRPLFDGRSTGAWRGFRKDAFPERGWVVEDGALRVVAGGGGGDLVTRDEFTDFELRLEWKVAKGANSGIMFRVSEAEGAPWRTGPEYQILDDGGHADGKQAKTAAGSLYALIAADGKQLRPPGEWNEARILLDGARLEHWLNGRRVVATTMAGDDWQKLVAASKFRSMPGFAREARGRICLQDHGDDVWFRNVRVRELRKPADEITLFDGKSLAGWVPFVPDSRDAASVFQVDPEGHIVCSGKPHGYLRTEQEFDHFVLELEWRWSPATKQTGNSGVLFRMIGEDKVWPKSIEAQLQHGQAGDFWRIDEFPMQVAPERTNGRNTKRLAAAEHPVGEWNRYRITVEGGRVLLEINGKEVNFAADAQVVPGKICLQSEGAEIHFRDIRLTPLR
jgi:hypothetical protein